MTTASIADVRNFFKTGNPERDGAKSFLAEWKALTDQDKADLQAGIGSGSLTY